MKSSAKNVKLTSVDDLFSTEESRATEQREKVMEIPLSELHPFKDHPFKVLDDERMLDTVESVKQYGVLAPVLARPHPEGGYELVSGHRRHRAAELAGLATCPRLSVTLTMMKPRSSWWIPICKGKRCCRAKERGRIG